MRLNRLSLAALLLAGSASVVPAVHGQSFGVATGVASESRMNTGGSVQLSYFMKTGLPQLGLRLDALYVQQPNDAITGYTEDGRAATVSLAATRSYGVLGGLTYQVGKRAVQPYAVVGAGFYSRDSYTGGFALGANAGIGTNARVGRLHLFGEARIHSFNHTHHVPWATMERVRIVPFTIGLRF
jgi:hypothetical protein